MEVKYLLDGDAVQVVATTDAGVIIRRMYDGGPTGLLGDQEVVNQVFDEPPTAVRSQNIAELEAKLAALRTERDGLREEIRTAKSERDSLVARLKEVPALRRIDDFIAGRFTHYLTEDGGTFEIIAVADARCEGASSYSRELKLLTLFGATNGDLSWRLNRYKDGSGNGTMVHLCQSEQEAKDLIVERINQLLTEEPATRGCWFRYYEKSLQKYGLPVPDVITTRLRDDRVKGFTDAKAKAQSELEAANKALEEIRIAAGLAGNMSA